MKNKKRIENLEKEVKQLKEFLGKWLSVFYKDWVKLRHNSLINTVITMKQIKQESKMFYESCMNYKDLKERLEKIEEVLGL